ncbi:glycosyltransferase family 4 protein [Paramicrobacterium fandaimingii]|uniref:glycosyltransferase family 4 protein n=1 Tax=Paramicrobacterium fandaimingii TaxID=2708079 RepID=UPI00141FAF52|nr:glycosyltransferase family 4 protein [Microbacterium fandaimingii]
MSRPRILCISLSPIERDARVLRQISVLAEYGDVVTVGYGETPEGATEHVGVPGDLPSLPQDPIGVLKLATRRFRSAELSAPGIRFAKKALTGRRFDLVVANDARVLDLAFSVADGAPVWADMHEWAPEERTHVLSWRLLVAPFMTHLCRAYLPRAAAVTTVGGRIAELYSSAFGVRPRVMRNAAPYATLEPQPVTPDSIRLVHSGAAVYGRNLELMIDAMQLLDDRFTLDLYLVSAADGGTYLNQLKERAAGDTRVRFRDPVKPNDLPRTLNSYDVGVFWIPPVHTNARYTLPNKLFDFVQARLAVAIGPSEEMVDVVTQYELGVVSRDFTAESCADSLRSLTANAVTAFKAKTDAAARELSFETEAQVARSILAEALSR